MIDISPNELAASMRRVRTRMKPELLDFYLQTTLWRFVETFRTIPPNQGNMELVDIGCYGPVIGPLHELLGYKRIGAAALYDWGPFDLEVLPAWANESGIELTPWIGDVERQQLPWNTESIDVVLMLEIIEHFAIDPMHALCEVNRILCNGGYLVLSTPNAASLAALRRITSGRNPAPEPYNGDDPNRHNRLYDTYELSQILSCAGFDDISTRSIGGVGLRKWRPVDRIIQTVSSLLSKSVNNLQQVLRGDVLLTICRKARKPSDRYPRPFYSDRRLFDDWHNHMDTHSAEKTPVRQSDEALSTT